MQILTSQKAFFIQLFVKQSRIKIQGTDSKQVQEIIKKLLHFRSKYKVFNQISEFKTVITKIVINVELMAGHNFVLHGNSQPI